MFLCEFGNINFFGYINWSLKAAHRSIFLKLTWLSHVSTTNIRGLTEYYVLL